MRLLSLFLPTTDSARLSVPVLSVAVPKKY